MSDNLPIKTAIKVISFFTLLLIFHIYIYTQIRARSSNPLINMNRQLEQQWWDKLEQKEKQQDLNQSEDIKQE